MYVAGVDVDHRTRQQHSHCFHSPAEYRVVQRRKAAKIRKIDLKGVFDILNNCLKNLEIVVSTGYGEVQGGQICLVTGRHIYR